MNTITLCLPIAICGTSIFLISEFGEVPTWIPWFSHGALEVMGHLGLYAWLGFLVARYFSATLGLTTMVLILFTADVCGLYGITDEFHQIFVPGRSAELFDVMTDFIGGLLGASVYVAWRQVTGCLETRRYRPELGTAAAIRKAIPALTAFVLVVTPAIFHWGTLADFVRPQADNTWMNTRSQSNGSKGLNSIEHALSGFQESSDHSRLKQAPQTSSGPSMAWETNQDLLDFVRVVSVLSGTNRMGTVRP